MYEGGSEGEPPLRTCWEKGAGGVKARLAVRLFPFGAKSLVGMSKQCAELKTRKIHKSPLEIVFIVEGFKRRLI
jgi:hypothetical protein